MRRPAFQNRVSRWGERSSRWGQRDHSHHSLWTLQTNTRNLDVKWMQTESKSHFLLNLIDLDRFLLFQVYFRSVTQSCPTLCNPRDCSTPGFPVHHQLPELAQAHVHWVSDAIQPSHPLLPASLPVFHLSQHQSLFQWVSSSHQVAKVSEFQLEHQSFQWIFRTDFL